MSLSNKQNKQSHIITKLEGFLFWSRWLQAPLYLGLVIGQMVYVYLFGIELFHLIANVSTVSTVSETGVMLSILGMIDLVMVANLLYMVVVGGYETFVSKLSAAENHQDRPDWLGHIDANLLKIKLAISLITISSIHLLKTFINAPIILLEPNGIAVIISQLGIHVAFLLSAIAVAYVDKMVSHKA